MNKVRATYKRSLAKDEYRMKTVISSSKCSMWGDSLVVHEIGHGVYKFQHTFDYGVAEKSTDNLMDYNNGDFLAHYQWRVMQDSVMFVWGLFQDDEDGMWTTDGHFYILRYVGLCMGMSKDEAFKLASYAEEPDSHVYKENTVNVIKQNSDGSLLIETIENEKMFERLTWLIPGQQETNHALTQGFHGVEFAATTYAILKLKDMDAIQRFLLHRFGDCFAHMNMWNGSVPDKGVVATIDNSRAIELANRLFVALDGLGTNDNEVKEILLSGRFNSADITLIYRAFGIRNGANLILWLDDEYSNTQIRNVENDFYLKLVSVFNQAGYDWKYVCAHPDETPLYYGTYNAYNASLDGYMNSIDHMINNNFKFVNVGYTVKGHALGESEITQPVETDKGPMVYTTLNRTTLTNFIVSSILNANRGDESYSSILSLEWIYSHILDELDKYAPAIQNHYEMYGADAEGAYDSNVSCFGHTRHSSMPDQILRRLSIYKTYVKYVIELYLKMKQVGLVQSDISENNSYSEVEKILDWCKSSKDLDFESRLDGIFAFLIAVKEAKLENVKEKRFTIPVKWTPQRSRDEAGSALSAVGWLGGSRDGKYIETAFNIYNTLVTFLSNENNYRKYGVKDVVYNEDLREENIHVNSVIEFKIILE